ncbi:MAG: prepilin-type N-terminal cleavage/methylation domain-containing protein, partial [Thermodesulfobacteriota bacterium]
RFNLNTKEGKIMMIQISRAGIKDKGLSKQKGFTLLEVMVSLVILGAGLLLIIQLFSGGLISAKVSDDYNKVILHAKGKMNDVLTRTELSAVREEGVTEDGFLWMVEVMPYLIKGLEETESSQTYTVKVEVKDPNGRKGITLETLKTILLVK